MRRGSAASASSTTRSARSTPARPSELRRRARRRRGTTAPGEIELRLAGARTARRRRAARVPRRPRRPRRRGGRRTATYRALARARARRRPRRAHARADGVRCVLRLDDLRDLTAAVARCRRLLDLDADPVSIVDPARGRSAARRARARAPGHAGARHAWTASSWPTRAIVGQQVSVAAARTVLGRLAATLRRAARGAGGRDHSPLPHRRGARRGRSGRAAVPAQARRRRCARSPGWSRSTGVRFDAGADSSEAARARCSTCPASAPGRRRTWRCARSATRTRSWPATSASGTRLRLLGGDAAALGRAWRPWRSYAVMHLWALVSAAPDGGLVARRGRAGCRARCSRRRDAGPSWGRATG